jgi:hypothetical protein
VTGAGTGRRRGPGRGVRWAAGLGASALTAVAITATLGSAPASASGFGGNFSAVAAADGVRVTVIVPHSGLSNEVADSGGPSVQARVDSLGTSKAFASFPYPGDTVANMPGLVRTLSGGVPVPDLPFFVQSDHPIVPKQEAGTGPYVLRAESDGQRSAATASAGLASDGIGALGLVRSDASVTSTAEAVASEATSTIESFFVGPLRLGHVVSHARVSIAPDGTRTQNADTEVFGAMVGSTPVSFTPAGLRVGAASAALPDTAALAGPLAAAGITVEVMPRQDLPTGVVAPAIRVTQKQQSGSQVVYVLGGASASGTGEAADSSAAAGGDGGPGSTAPSPKAESAAGAPTASGSSPNPVAADGASGLAAGSTSDGEAGSTGDGAAAAGAMTGTPAAGPAIHYPTSFVVPGPADAPTGAVATGSAPTAAAPAAPGRRTAPTARPAAAVTALLGTAVDARPLYGTLIAGGVLALGVAVAMRGLRPGGAR